jgi:transcriptional repressor NrdR
MKCPFCGSPDDQVLDSRPMEDQSVTRRRRVCRECNKRFTTYERLEESPLMVVKSDQRREPYNRAKLKEGVARACQKRPISSDAIENLLNDVETDLRDYLMEVPSRIIGETVLNKLRALDPVAYVRFASVYRQFSDIETFMEELKKLKKKMPKAVSAKN